MANLSGDQLATSFQYVSSLYQVAITKIVLVLVIILIGFIIAKFLGKITKRTLHEIGLDILAKKAGIKNFSLELILSKTVTYVIYFVVFLIVMNKLGFTTEILHIFSGAILILIVLLVALATKDIVPNMFAGLYIYQKKLVNEGDSIKVDSFEGVVKEVTLVETIIESKGDIVYIPNSALIKSVVVKKK